MKRVGLVMDRCFEEHDTGPGHPERPERLVRLRGAIEASGLAGEALRRDLLPAENAWLTAVHDEQHIRRVDEACERGDRLLDAMDTAICPASARLARLASGSLVKLCLDVASGELQHGFAALRPPGHHAERDLAMGFCLFNHVAVAAARLLEQPDISKVLIVDWDVHHGNGTQHIFEEDARVLFFSVHQSPLYPGTGAREERGRGAGQGTTLNCPLPVGAGDAEFLRTLTEELTPAAEAFAPDFVLVSAGFDAHRNDPLAQLEVSTEAYAEATRVILNIARQTAGGRVVSTLEGGYDLDALADSAVAHLGSLLHD